MPPPPSDARVSLRPVSAGPWQTAPTPPASICSTPSAARPKNVIFILGDGMGINQVLCSRYRYYGPGGRLNMERAPYTGLVDTHPDDSSPDNLVTDSAAAATALFTGCKTTRGTVGLSPAGVPVQSLAEAMKAAGYAVGIATTGPIAGATPGGLGAHVPSRVQREEIGRQVRQQDFEVIIGKRDGLAAGGAAMAAGRKSLLEHDVGQPASPSDRFIAFVDDLDSWPPATPSQPTLGSLTRKALDVLSRNDKGFFLLVEGDGIDEACHGQDIDKMTQAVRALDDAVGVAMRFAEQRGDTLVIVTADHETGGLTVPAAHYTADGAVTVDPSWLPPRPDGKAPHTAQPVPLFAFGAGAKAFAGLNDNTAVPHLIANQLGLKRFGQPQGDPVAADAA